MTDTSTQKLDGGMYARMLKAGAANLRAHVQTVNNLNVFPIPDGDTGDNMLLTIIGGADAAEGMEGSLSEVSRKAADGMLLSARGNSGVILSQIFEGIAEGLKGVEEADTMKFSMALKCGVQHAYNAVMEPTEGTILTVARCAGEYAAGRVSKSAVDFADNYISEAKKTLDETPEMLPVLKKAGVVDSGGAGLIYIAEGMRNALTGEADIPEHSHAFSSGAQELNLDLFTEDSILEYGYCTELLLRLQRSKTDPAAFNVDTVTDYLKTIGDSVVAFKTGSIIKIHVHTMTPDKVLGFCQRYGEFLKIKIENMSLQHNNTVVDGLKVAKPASDLKDYGIVAVCSGEGIKEFFTDRGADVIVDGGQCMNPSTESFLEAFRQVQAKTIFVLPNNGNVILSARQAAEMYKDANVRVIESKTIGDGYAALAMLDPGAKSADALENELKSAMEGVVTAEVSRSIRDAELDGMAVHTGDYLGFSGKELLAVSGDRKETVCETVMKQDPNCFEILMLIRGQDTDESEAEALAAMLQEKCPGKEIYVVDGRQEIYDYILIFE